MLLGPLSVNVLPLLKGVKPRSKNTKTTHGDQINILALTRPIASSLPKSLPVALYPTKQSIREHAAAAAAQAAVAEASQAASASNRGRSQGASPKSIDEGIEQLKSKTTAFLGKLWN